MTLNDTLTTAKDFANQSLARMNRLDELNHGVCDRLAKKQISDLDLLMEQGHDALAHAVNAKDLTSFFNGQVAAAQDLTRLVMAETRTNLEILRQVQADYQTWFKQSLAEVASDLRKAIPAV